MTQLLERIHGQGIKTRLELSEDMLQNIQESTWFSEIKESEHILKTVFLEYSINNHELNQDIPDELLGIIKEKLFTSIDADNNLLLRQHAKVSSVHILYIPDDSESHISLTIDSFGNSYNHLLIIAGKNVHSTILVEIYSTDKGLKTLITESIIGRDSDIYISLINKLSEEDIHFCHNTFEIEKDSKLYYTSIDLGAVQLVRDGLLLLHGDNSRVWSNNIYNSKNSANYDIYTIVEHQGRDTESLMKQNGVVKDAKVITRGLIRIKESAFNSNGYQKSEALLTHENSRAVSIPDLEIHNNEVKCSHGSSITNIDVDKVFYLQSRGMNREDAERIIIKGFFVNSLNMIHSEDVKNELVEFLEQDTEFLEQELGVVYE